MPKDKSSRTQNRKKQVTDVSDALFHVTPQPSIDIFEALGGAINVQTAAFLTGKVDSIDAPLANVSASSVEYEERAQNTVDESNTVIEETRTNDTEAPFAIQSTDTLAPQADSSSPKPSNAYQQTESTTSTNDESLMVATDHAASQCDSYNAIDHAQPRDSVYSSDTSTACHDQKTSTQNTPHDISHASTLDSQDDSTTTSTEYTPHNSTENSTPQTPKAAALSVHRNSTANSTQYINEKTSFTPEPTPLYTPLNTPASAHIQGSNLLSQLTKREEELLQFLRHHHGQIVSYSQMLKALNWRESQRCTARNIVARFEANGIIQRQRIQGTRSQGYLFTMCEQIPATPQQTPYGAYHFQQSPQHQNPATPPVYSMPNSTAIYSSTAATESNKTSIANSPIYSTEHIPQNQPQTSMHSYIDKIDRLIQSIWQSDQETISACWPAVAAAGFRSAHLRQLQSIFELQGFESDTVSLGLRYLDWQLEQGPLTNARGEIIEDPVAYWLSSMRRHGYYSRPKGYLDPILEAKRLLAEEEENKLALQTQLAQTRQQNEQAAEDERCEHLFAALMAQGQSHSLWSAFYQRLPQMFRQKVDAEGPDALAKKFTMVKALLKELV